MTELAVDQPRPSDINPPSIATPDSKLRAELTAAAKISSGLYALQTAAVSELLSTAETALAKDLSNAIVRYPGRITTSNGAPIADLEPGQLAQALGAAFSKQVFDKYKEAVLDPASSHAHPSTSSVILGAGVKLGSGVILGGEPALLDSLNGLNHTRSELTVTVDGAMYRLKLDAALQDGSATLASATGRALISKELSTATGRITAVNLLIHENSGQFRNCPFRITPESSGGFALTIDHGDKSIKLSPISIPVAAAPQVIELLAAMREGSEGIKDRASYPLLLELRKHCHLINRGSITIGSHNLTVAAEQRYDFYEKILRGETITDVPVNLGQSPNLRVNLDLVDGRLSGKGHVLAKGSELDIAFLTVQPRSSETPTVTALHHFFDTFCKYDANSGIVLTFPSTDRVSPPVTITRASGVTILGHATIRAKETGIAVEDVRIGSSSSPGSLLVDCAGLGELLSGVAVIRDVKLGASRAKHMEPAVVIKCSKGTVLLATPDLRVDDIEATNASGGAPGATVLVEGGLRAGSASSQFAQLLLNRTAAHPSQGLVVRRFGGFLARLGLGNQVEVAPR